MIKRLILKVLKRAAKKQGFGDFFAEIHVKQLLNEYRYTKLKEYPEIHKCHKKGFYYSTQQIGWADLSGVNYLNYISDFNYRKLHPMNGEYSHWIDDKLTFRLIFDKYKEHIPRYYYHISNDGVILQGIDLPGQYKKESYGLEEILHFLKVTQILAAKKRCGSGSEGFFVLMYHQNKYYVNSNEINEDEMVKFIGGLRDYILQEYIAQSSQMTEKYSTIRIQVIHEQNEMPQIVAAKIILYEPTNSCDKIVDMDTIGLYREQKIEISTGKYQSLNGENWGQIIPNWEEICYVIKKICEDYPELCYMGFDVRISETNFYILEINSHSGGMLLPVMEKEGPLKDFFVKRLKAKGLM